MGRNGDRGRLRLLLASSSMAALLIGGGAPAWAAGCETVSGSSGPIANSVAITCVNIQNATVSGNVINTGTGVITAAGNTAPTGTGITINNASVSGAVINQGVINAASGNGIFVSNNALVIGGISNSGTIAVGKNGILVGGTSGFSVAISNFSGNIVNSGSITAMGAGLAVSSVGTFIGNVSNSGMISAGSDGIVIAGLSSFIGNVSNSGTIAAGRTYGIFVEDLSVFIGNVSNSGTISAFIGIDVGCDCGIPTFIGNVSNSGTIEAGRFGILVGNTIPVGGVTTFIGNVANSGTIAASEAGIFVGPVGTFTGNVSNSGTIAASGAGIVVGSFTSFGSGVKNFSGNVVNSGTITASQAGILVNNVRTFTGNVSNSGLIAVSGTGIVVTDVRTFTGNVANSGTISSRFGAGIFVGGSGTGISTFIGNINNTGTIRAARTGIAIVGVSTFSGTVSNSGTIIAGRTGIFICDCVAFSDSSIVNSGSITAASGIVVHNFSKVSIFDSGTIVGTGGIAVDLTNASGGNTFTLGPGYSIVGSVAAFAGGIDTFQLGGAGSGQFDLSSIGAAQQYENFTTFNVVSGTWTVYNTFSQSQAWNVLGGTLAGTGTLPAINVSGPGGGNSFGGGTLEPGNVGQPGTSMTVTGNLTFQPGANYLVNLSPTTASRADVGGTAFLNGAVEGVLAPGSYNKNTTYDILDAAGISGAFSSFTAVNAPGFGGTLSVSGDPEVLLNLTAQLGAGNGLNQNQQNVANAVNAAFNNGGTLPASFFPLFTLSGSNLANALSRVDGEDAIGAERGAFDLMNEFLGLMLDPFVDGRGGTGGTSGVLDFAPDQQNVLPPDIALAYSGLLKAPPPQPAFGQRWSTWASGFGGNATANGDPAVGSNNVTTSTYGYAAGMDYHYSPDTVLGFSLAGGGTNWNLANALGIGRSDALLAGVYGVTHDGPWYLGGALAFANNWFTTNRAAFSGDQLRANFQGQSYSARLEGGYRFAVPSAHNAVGITPYAAIQVQNFQTPAYSETDLTGGGLGLSFNAMNGTDTRSELGSRFDDLTTLDNLPLVLRAKLAWAHDWVSNPALNASFTSLPGTAFTVNGAPIPQNSALTSASAQLFFTPNWSLLAKFDGEFASGTKLYAGTGTLRYTW